MEIKMLSSLKKKVLALDIPQGVNKKTLHETSVQIRQFMGIDASAILNDAMEVDEDENIFFPNEGDSLKVWKRMLHAYKVEHSLDNDEHIVG